SPGRPGGCAGGSTSPCDRPCARPSRCPSGDYRNLRQRFRVLTYAAAPPEAREQGRALEASVLSQPAKLTALGVRAPFLALQADEKLIDLIRAGDEAAFEALVQRYRSRLLAFCRHMLRSQEDAEDVLQEVFAASYRAIVADEREILVRP